MAKINLEQLDRYMDQEEKPEKIRKKSKPGNPNKKHIKKESKHIKDIDWESVESDN